MQALLIALALLTQMPVAGFIRSDSFTPHTRRQSVLWFPSIGILLSALLLGGHWLVQALPAHLQAMLLLMLWVAASGAMHLDGLADCTDAAAAAHSSREKMLSIFKQADVGAMAVVMLVLVLLLKAVLLYSVITATYATTSIACAVTSARILAVYYMLLTPYARVQGMATDLTQSNLLLPFSVQTGLLFALFAVYIPIIPLSISLLVLVVLLILWRRFWLVRIKGYVGDCIGAFIELAEVLVLFVFTVYATVSL